MSMKIQSTPIREDGIGSATIEMTIADEADQATTRAEDISPPASVQFPLEREIVFLRMVVVADHNILPALQGDAITNAITALEGVRRRLEKR